MCDICKKFSNTKEPTIELLPEFQYRLNTKFRMRENLWLIQQQNVLTDRLKELKLNQENPSVSSKTNKYE
jgi:hypothetical protein